MCMLKIGNFQIMDHVGIVHNSYIEREGGYGKVPVSMDLWGACGYGCGWTMHTFFIVRDILECE